MQLTPVSTRVLQRKYRNEINKSYDPLIYIILNNHQTKDISVQSSKGVSGSVQS